MLKKAENEVNVNKIFYIYLAVASCIIDHGDALLKTYHVFLSSRLWS